MKIIGKPWSFLVSWSSFLSLMFHGFYWTCTRSSPSMTTKKSCLKDVPIYRFGSSCQATFPSCSWWPTHPWTFSFTASCPRFSVESSLATSDYVCLLFLRLFNEWVKSNFQFGKKKLRGNDGDWWHMSLLFQALFAKGKKIKKVLTLRPEMGRWTARIRW